MEAEWRRLQQESSQHGIDPERGLEIEAEIISELMDEQASGPDVLDTYEGDAGTQSSTALADAEMDMDESQTLRSEICPVCQLPTLSEAPGRIECANCGLFVAVESPCPAASQRTSGSQSRSACTKQRQSPNLAEFQVGLHQIAEQHSTQCHFGTLQAGFDASIGLFFICSHCDELAIA
nr:hypothetical protein HK105_007824 [Polyrhizophydium stewartii]